MTDSKSDTPSPKERLLDAAEVLFASGDFNEVSVREIAAQAGMNVAAVNYHFQGKEKLFHEVIIRRFSAQRDRTLNELRTLLHTTSGKPAVAEVIEVLVREYLAGALGNNFLTVMTRDLHTGNHASHAPFFKEIVAPVFASISEALIAARPSLAQDDLNWIIASIVAQIHHFILRRLKADNCADDSETRAIMLRAFPVLALDKAEYIRRTTAHITRFSTAAIDGLFPEEE